MADNSDGTFSLRGLKLFHSNNKEALQTEIGIIMTKKLNSFKNIISVLMALLILGIAAGPTSAVPGNFGAGDNVIVGGLNQRVTNITTQGSHGVNALINITFKVPNSGLTFNTTSIVIAEQTNNSDIVFGTLFQNATLISINAISGLSADDEITISGIKVDVSENATVGLNYLNISSPNGYDITSIHVNVTPQNLLSAVVAPWDIDNSGTISKLEALAAVANYFLPGGISKADALEIVAAYFTTNAT